MWIFKDFTVNTEDMTINDYLDTLGWTKPMLADWLAVNLRTVLRWCSGQNETPPTVLDWLATLARIMEERPLGWQMPVMEAVTIPYDRGARSHG